MQFKRSNIEYNGRDKYGTPGGGNKFRKRSFVYGNMTYAGGGGGGGLTPVTPPNPTGGTHVFDIDAGTYIPISNIQASQITSTGITIQVPFYGFADGEDTQVWIGTTNGTAADNFGISGCTTGISATSITNNGTTEPVLNLKFTNELTLDSGELQIPILVNSSPYLEVFTGATTWENMAVLKKVTPKVITYCWNIKSAGGGTGYIMDLSNENASVNADVDGNIYSASTATLQCKATLYYNNIEATGVTYTVFMPIGTAGVTIYGTTGILSFNPQTFTFTGMSTNITVTASKDGVSMQKVMRITKIKDSSSGGGVRRWIVPSVNVTVLSVDSSVTPSVVTATVMKQVSGNPPEVDNETTIFYGFSPGQLNPTITMPSTGVTIADTVEYLILALREGDVYSGTIYEQETIHMIAEGTGPTVRGPITWRSSLARRFSNGVGPQQQDRDFIDVVRYQFNTYKCVTSYTQTAGQTWSQVSSNWELDNSYNFVASEIDLAQNANIELHDTNLIVIQNSTGGTVGQIGTTSMFYGGTTASNAKIAMYPGGALRCGGFQANNITSQTEVIAQTYRKNTGHEYHYLTPFAPVEMNINFVHDDADKDDFIQNIGGVWCVNGNSTEISSEEFPYLRVIDRDDEYHQDKLGWFMVSTSPEPVEDEDFVFTGVVNSSVQRLNNVMYITL